jgi:4-amino-4-deoxy-L-arabinose transferase-like glycosyltransferase
VSVGLAGHRAAGSESGGPQAIFLLVLVPFALVIFFFRLGSYSLVNGDEAFYQAVAEAMVDSGD